MQQRLNRTIHREKLLPMLESFRHLFDMGKFASCGGLVQRERPNL